MVPVHPLLARRVILLDFLFERLGACPDRFLVGTVSRGIRLEPLSLRRCLRAQRRTEFGEILLVTLRLVVGPLICSLGFPDRASFL